MLPNIDDVPVISISNQLNPEQIISLRTELLFIAKGMEVPQRDLLENAGVKVVEYPANSLKSLQERVQATAKSWALMRKVKLLNINAILTVISY